MLVKTILFTLLLISLSAESLAIVHYVEDRRKTVDIGTVNNQTSYPNPLFVNWTNGSLKTAISTTNITASGWSESYSEIDWYTYDDYFDMTFSIMQNVQLDLSGELYAIDFNNGAGYASIRLYAGDTTVLGSKIYDSSVIVEFDYGEQNLSVSDNIALTNGTYRLVIKATTYTQEAYSSFNIQASFTATHTTNGTPMSWLSAYSLVEDSLDPDKDGMATWEEYTAATDPTNGLSVFSINYGRTNSLILMNTAPSRIYGLEASSNLLSGAWVPLTNNIQGTGLPVNIAVDAVSGIQLFRGTVRVP